MLKFKSPSKWNSYEGFNLEHFNPPPLQRSVQGDVWAHPVRILCFQVQPVTWFTRTNPYTRSFLVGCLNPCLQQTSVRVVAPQPQLQNVIYWLFQVYSSVCVCVFPWTSINWLLYSSNSTGSTTNSPPTHTGVGHQWTMSSSNGCKPMTLTCWTNSKSGPFYPHISG